MALQAQRSTSYALTGLLEAEAGWDVLVPPVGSSLGDGSDVARFGGEVVLATASTHDDSEGVGGLGSVERVGPQLANVTDGYVLPAAGNAVEAGAVPAKRPSPRSWPREGASDPDGDFVGEQPAAEGARLARGGTRRRGRQARLTRGRRSRSRTRPSTWPPEPGQPPTWTCRLYN